jgi:hypothetical protein
LFFYPSDFLGCWECQYNYWACIDWQGLLLPYIFFFVLVLIISHAFILFFPPLQDPTEQVAIDNLMVQQLDGTVNEWGWCKQKVA